MKERKKINEILLEEIDSFRFFNKMSVEEMADFFGLKPFQIRNWKNSPGFPNPTAVDLWKIENAQRSKRGNILRYRINVTRVISGKENTYAFEQLAQENRQLRTLLKQKEIELYKLGKSGKNVK